MLFDYVNSETISNSGPAIEEIQYVVLIRNYSGHFLESAYLDSFIQSTERSDTSTILVDYSIV